MHPRGQRVGQHLQAVHQPRTRPAEILRAVHHVHPTRTHRRQGPPGRDRPRRRQVLQRPLHAEPAAGDHHHLRLPRPHLVPIQPARRLAPPPHPPPPPPPPPRPTPSTPPARRTSSGLQGPQKNGGSSHSSRATRGRRSR